MNLLAFTALTQMTIMDLPPIQYWSGNSTSPFFTSQSKDTSAHQAGLSTASSVNDLETAIELNQQRQAAIAGAERMTNLPAGWDGQGAMAPDRLSLAAAVDFLRNAPLPRRWEPTLHADGRAILELETDHRHLELIFGVNDTVIVIERPAAGPIRSRTVPLHTILGGDYLLYA